MEYYEDYKKYTGDLLPYRSRVENGPVAV